MRKALTLITILCISMLLLPACINLKNVQDYTKSSITTISKFEELHYTFNKHCTERCLFESVRKNIISREADCNCASYKKADSITFVLYNTIYTYFSALGDLANDNVTNYSLDTLQNAITEDFIPVGGKNISITADQVSSYFKIAKTLLTAATNAYRGKKIKQFIAEGNEPVKILIASFQQILSDNLSALLDFKKERLNMFYNEIVLDSGSSIYERRKATLEYYENIDEVNNRQRQIEALSSSLQKVAEGHQKLANSNFSRDELKRILAPISAEIKAFTSKFNKFKNS